MNVFGGLIQSIDRRIQSDETLMIRYQQGDSGAFEVLYKRHKDGLFAFLYRSCGQSAIVEELAQEAWFAIIRRAETYQPSAKFKTYLFRVAYNKLVDHWRRQQPIGQAAVPDSVHASSAIIENIASQAPDSSNLEAGYLQYEIQGKLTKALSELPNEQRQVFLLREDGFSHEEIAGIVGVGKETVKSRLRYASKQLKSRLKDLKNSNDPEPAVASGMSGAKS